MVWVISLLAGCLMKIRTKIALLVGFCTFLMLGSYYLLSLQSATNALIDFHKRSTIILEQSIPDPDQLQQALQQHQAGSAAELLQQLKQQFPQHHFLLLLNKKLQLSTLTDEDFSLEADETERGFHFKLKGPDNRTSVVYLVNEPLPVQLAGHSYGVLTLPKSLLGIGGREDQLRSSLHQSFALWFGVLSVVAVVLAWLGARYLLSPMHQLKAGFARLEQGDLSFQINSERTDEVGSIFQSFNELASTLQRLQQQYKQMSSDIAHELRTPLTALRSRLEAIQDGLVQADPTQVAQLLDDLQNLTRLVEDLRLLSLSEAGQLKVELQQVDAAALLQHLHQAYLPLAQQAGLEFELQLQQAKVLADPLRLRQVMTNLLDNAFKYGSAGKQIRLSIQAVGTDWQLEVADQGPGIQAQPAELVFERFYRDPLSGKQPGSGLGLAICKQLTELMHGRISVHSETGKGSSFYLLLPAFIAVS
jgi:signal transduction histidine kinase